MNAVGSVCSNQTLTMRREFQIVFGTDDVITCEELNILRVGFYQAETHPAAVTTSGCQQEHWRSALL